MLLRPRLRSPSLLIEADSICTRCLRKLRRPPPTLERRISTSSPSREAAATSARYNGLRRGYFWANSSLDEAIQSSRRYVWNTAALKRASGATAVASDPNPISESVASLGDWSQSVPISSKDREELPHRRRKRLKQLEELQRRDNGELVMPPDASSRLSTISQSLPQASLRRKLAAYLSLAKPRLSFLIILTTTTAYSIYPVPDVLSPTATTAPSLSTMTLVFLTAGTGLACASANAFNMLFEPAQDAKMSRTRNRPLVRGLLTRRAALLFALAAGALGITALHYGVNPTTAALGAANIILYAGVYTPLKRVSAANTWAGALVGAIPPLMGWTAAAGQTATTTLPEGNIEGAGGAPQWRQLLLDTDAAAGGWLLAALLFAWQFPHFNALSWPVREEYRAAGLRMLAWTNPARNARVALRYSLLMFPICWGLAQSGVVEWGFVPASAVVNGWMAWEAVKFWRWKGERGSARGLFWASVWHLPVVMVLAMVMKKGLWERVWRGVAGVGEEEEWEDEG